jgi:hypothetical protein
MTGFPEEKRGYGRMGIRLNDKKDHKYLSFMKSQCVRGKL